MFHDARSTLTQSLYAVFYVHLNFTLWFQGTKLVRTKVNVPVSLVVCLSQSFKFVHASKLAEAGFTEEVSSKMLSLNVLALELIASFFKDTGVRQKGKQVVRKSTKLKSFYISCTACAVLTKLMVWLMTLQY